MKRALQFSCVVLLMFLGLVASPSPAFAADSFTIDDLPDGKVLIETETVWFRGTSTSVDDDMDIFVFIDNRLLTCDDDFGNDFNDFSCVRTWTASGTTWEFPVGRDEVERLGLAFAGPHEVRFVQTRHVGGTNVVQSERTLSLEFVDSLVTPSPTPLPETVLPAPIHPTESRSSVSMIATGDPSAPSVLSAVRPFTEVPVNPVSALVTAAVTIILLLLVGLPSALLGQSLSENYDRMFGRLSAAIQRASRTLATPSLPGWLPIAFGMALATVMSAFVDPGFGWNPGSVRVLVSMGIAFAVESVAGWFVIRSVLARTDPDLDPKPEFKFGSLIIVLLAVVVSRIVGFEPGMVFGLVVGLTFGASLAASRDARVKLIGLGWAFAIGVVGWVGYSLLAGVPGWLPVFAAETLSALAVSSLAALPVALLPLADLDGGVLFRWNRWVWAGVYATEMFVFFVVLMPMPFSWGDVGTPLATWVGLYLAYAVFAVAVWAWFRVVKQKSTQAELAEI